MSDLHNPSDDVGTAGLSAPVNAALCEAGRQRVLAAFDVRCDVDGTPDEVAANRQDRHPPHVVRG